MIPRYGAAPRPGHHYRLRPGAYAIVMVGTHVLLTEQTLETGAEIQLPGGGIDPGEAPVPALHREIYEETGWHCQVIRRLGAYRRFTWMAEYGFHAEKLCTIYLAQATMRIGAPTERGHRPLLLDPAVACDRIANPADRPFLRDVARRMQR
ncbi:NUDIX hydrolase [Jannaschia pagri]|uniref:NUDIX hydrolase n=1 Tax=Jannaschia pagri TaxID=2829797 RepID=A0ABQ4NQ52_9RHOB|nr:MULTISPECIES: NUDIX domain-containing protein [unclassified Jannaschia]GIT92642.1 NUDIX hydrolase [Jannaschia sp. AI_61]GIT96498.1 NUDIX hydrolase [Jannaschia sp. AI_62]